MKAIETLTNAVGLYGLTADGELGVYSEGNVFTPDRELTQAFAPQIRQLLKSYLGNPDGDGHRLGIVYHAREPKTWKSDTMALEEAVVREVYPVSGPTAKELTAFQKKNREKSVYRGIELLVEYRYERLDDSFVYCPLLYDRETYLDEYAAHLGFGGKSGERTPVIELLNLIAMIPFGRRNTPALLALMERLHEYLGRSASRRADAFTIRTDRYVAPKDSGAAVVEFFDVDKRHERQQTLNASTLGRRLAAAEQAQSADRFDQVQRWLERPHRAVDAALLRGFNQFRDLDGNYLALLAEKALVHTAPGGMRLLDVGMKDSWNMYLLEGTVLMQAADGGSLFVTGGTDKAASPISFLKPRKYTVSSVTPVSFLWIHDALLDAISVPPDPDTRPASALKPSRR